MSENADEEHHTTFSEDRRPSSVPSGKEPPLVCPNTLDEMLQIVSNVRQSRMDVLRDYQVQAAKTYVAAEHLDESMFPSIPASI